MAKRAYIAVIGAVVIVTALAAVIGLEHSNMNSLAAGVKVNTKFAYIAVRPDANIVHAGNMVYSAQLRQNSINAILDMLPKFVKEDVFVVVDIRGAAQDDIDVARTIFKEMTRKLRKPIVLIGSPDEIKEVVRSFAKIFGIPVYEVSGKSPSQLVYTKIDTIVYAYVPENVAGPGSISVTNVVNKDSNIINRLNDVINRVSQYVSKRSSIQFEYTLPSSTAILLHQLDASQSFYPYGKINARDAVYLVTDDGNPDYDWYIYRFIDQIIPGTQLWDSGWLNNKLIQEIDADYNDPTGFLSYYNPTTYVSATTTTWTVELSVSGSRDRDGVSIGGSLVVGYSWSYTKPDIEILDRSDYSLEIAKWENDIDEEKAVGSSTVQLEPGAIIRYPEDGQTHHWRTVYLGQWAKKDCLIFDYLCSWDYSDYYGIVVDWTLTQ